MRAALAFLIFISMALSAWPLSIVRNFLGGERGPMDVGGGNLADIFNTAADIWEEAIPDPHVLVLHYRWAPVGGGIHYLQAQGGNPHRENEGLIEFNNDADPGHIHFYLDPTPRDAEEYTRLVEMSADYGGGAINAARYYTDPSDPDAASFAHVDLVTVALHEIGHALGISMDNSSFTEETAADVDVDVVSPLPFAGTTFRVTTNLFGITSHLDIMYGNLMAGANPRERRLPSAADILVNAQLSQFRNINLELGARLKIERSGPTARVSWWEIRRGFILEQTTVLGSAAGWQPVEETPTRNNGTNLVLLPSTDSSRFFRLRRNP